MYNKERITTVLKVKNGASDAINLQMDQLRQLEQNGIMSNKAVVL